MLNVVVHVSMITTKCGCLQRVDDTIIELNGGGLTCFCLKYNIL